MVTIFTPTYNRGSLLGKLYESLKKQSCKEFEWIIVDDGSTDDTEQVVNTFINEGEIDITYQRQSNGGKHVAINTGVSLANGRYFFIVDSDDCLPSNSIEIIYKWLRTIDNDDSFAGVGGLKSFPNKLIGTTFDGEFVDCKSTERNKYNITGDKAEIFKLAILKKYPFPRFDGEKFITESVVWNKISLDGYKIRWFNEVIYYGEYLDGGLTKTRGNFYKNYQGYIESIKVNLQCKELPLKERLKSYVVCCVYAKKKKYGYKKLAKQLGTSVCEVAILAILGSFIYKLLGGSVD